MRQAVQLFVLTSRLGFEHVVAVSRFHGTNPVSAFPQALVFKLIKRFIVDENTGEPEI
mgnify:FL=1